MNDDIYRDKYGGMVTTRSVAERYITYRRGGYEYNCMAPVYQLRRDFSLTQTAPHSKSTSRGKAHANIQEIKKTFSVFRGKR